MTHKLINPVVDMEKEPMDELTKQVQSRICKCPERCEYYIMLDGYGRYCEQAALEIAKGLFALVSGINRLKPKRQRPPYTPWALAEEQLIKDYYYNNGCQFNRGDYLYLGELLNREHGSVRNRIGLMRKEGRL